jgi:hypothetical protein
MSISELEIEQASGGIISSQEIIREGVKTFMHTDICPKKDFMHKEDLMVEGKISRMVWKQLNAARDGWLDQWQLEQAGKAAGPSNDI